MRVYLDCAPNLGRAIHRVVRELATRAPRWVEVVPSVDAADLVVHHVVGVRNFHPDLDLPALIATQRKPYAIIQYCLKTTEQPDPLWWAPIWEQAQVVWSYYDLPQLAGSTTRFPFYHAPLGVSQGFRDLRHPEWKARPYLVGTSGYVAASEYVEEWVRVAATLNRRVFHLGPQLPEFAAYPGVVDCAEGLTDLSLAYQWGQCQFVSGLRAVEGFELPAAEGLLSGARPVLFNREEHLRWFGPAALYVEEGPREQVERDLLRLVQARRYPLAAAARQFDWAPIIEGFWARVEAER